MERPSEDVSNWEIVEHTKIRSEVELFVPISEVERRIAAAVEIERQRCLNAFLTTPYGDGFARRVTDRILNPKEAPHG